MSVSERSLRTGVEPPVDAAGDGRVAGAGPPGRRARITGRARAERNLAWKLCAPAVVVMLLVTGYPIVYAIWLSLQKYDLRFPDEREFVGLANYGDVLSSSLWWDDLFTTLIITAITVVIELVLGLGLALLMHRALFGRRTVRRPKMARCISRASPRPRKSSITTVMAVMSRVVKRSSHQSDDVSTSP